MTLRSDIDSERFGFPIGKVSPASAAELDAVLQQAAAEGLRALFARCPADDWSTVHELERRGFLLMDTLVYFRRSLQGELPPGSGGCLIRVANGGDEPAIDLLAREAFADYGGHYNTDARLDLANVREIYPSWARRAVADRNVADVVLLAEVEGRIAGFGALKDLGNGALDAILYAVSPTFRRRGVFGDLLCAAVRWGRGKGFTAMEYSTHLNNVAAQRSVCRIGFTPDRSYYTFHLWLDRQ